MRLVYKYIIVAVVSALLTLLIRSWLVSPIPPEVIEREVVVYRDTSKFVTPKPFQVVSLPNYAFLSFPTDTVLKYVDNFITDSVLIPVPITQKVYKDSSYVAYVSGFEPSLDSIFTFNKTSVITNTIKPKRSSVAPFVSTEFSTIYLDAKAGVALRVPISNRFYLDVSGGYEVIKLDNFKHGPFLETRLFVNIFNW